PKSPAGATVGPFVARCASGRRLSQRTAAGRLGQDAVSLGRVCARGASVRLEPQELELYALELRGLLEFLDDLIDVGVDEARAASIDAQRVPLGHVLEEQHDVGLVQERCLL